MKVIFLDIDGVLNNRSTIDRTPNNYIGVDEDNIALLKEIIDATSAEIILSSDWRLEWNSDGSVDSDGKYLIDKLAKFGLKIKDITPNLGNYHMRGAEIHKYLENHPEIDNFVILDDIYFSDFDLWDLTSHLVKTVRYYGLVRANKKAAIDILLDKD